MPWPMMRVVAVLAALVAFLGVLNLWQLYRAGKASEACQTLLAKAQADYAKLAIERDTESVSISRENVADAQADAADAATQTDERIERVRTIIRNVPAPANCPVSLPSSVQDNLRDAAAAANR